jgi:uncharacterized protein YkwD
MIETYLPIIGKGNVVGGVGDEVSVEQQLFTLMRLHPYQARVGMQWSDKLAEVAEDRCISQARQGWTGHVSPGGYGPNWWVRLYGYRLPDWYSHDDDANSIESVAHNGDGNPAGVWASWMDSQGHRTHVLGLNKQYREQICVGIGYYYLPTSEKRHYWSCITAPREE